MRVAESVGLGLYSGCPREGTISSLRLAALFSGQCKCCVCWCYFYMPKTTYYSSSCITLNTATKYKVALIHENRIHCFIIVHIRKEKD